MKYEEPKLEMVMLSWGNVITGSIEWKEEDPNGEITLPDDL